MNDRGTPVTILLIEDNPGDVRLTQEALKEGTTTADLRVAQDGEEALSMLADGDEADLPDLVLLDLNLPRKDGREVLEEIKGDARLRRIPVIVLTTSEAERDVRNVYDLHANCYVTKPVDLDRFLDVLQRIQAFWCDVATLPEY